MLQLFLITYSSGMCWALCPNNHSLCPPFQYSPSTFPQVIPIEKPALPLPTHHSGQAEGTRVGSKNVCEHPSYNTNLSLWWLLLYWLVFPTDHEQLEGQDYIFYLCHPGLNWVLANWRTSVNVKRMFTLNLITATFWSVKQVPMHFKKLK